MDFTKKPKGKDCSVGTNYHFDILSQIWEFFPVALEPLLTVLEKTAVSLAKVTEDSKPSFVQIENNQN